MTARVLFKPYVCMPREPEDVCSKIPISAPDEYLEITLTADEAEDYAFALWQDARRARYMREVNLRIARRTKA